MRLRAIVYSIFCAVLVLVAYVAVVSYWSYSSGERAGWVQKFSNKGWVCKTWEGEMAMVSLPGTTVRTAPRLVTCTFGASAESALLAW
jgi:hypothetical protein